MRCGLIAKKIGMTRVFDEHGSSIPVSVLKMDSCQVISKLTKDTHGYNALQIGYGDKKAKNLSKAERGHFSKNNVEPKEKIAEFRVSEDALIDVGKKIGVNHFVSGQKVDVIATSKGKGFAGAMKRHNFAGLRASHGVSISHRSHGSTGQCQDPGKVFKGKKMAGHLGDAKVTIQNLQIVRTDPDKGLIMIKGAVPGAKGGWVTLKDAVKKKISADVPYPTATGNEVNKVNEEKPGDLVQGDSKQIEDEKAERENIVEGETQPDLEAKDES